MSRMFRSLGLASAAALIAVTAFAAPAQSAAPKAKATKAAKAHSVVGTLDKYDSGANSIVVNTGKGTETLTLSSSSSVRMGASKMTASDLSGHTGDRVKVRYSEANGQRTVQSVQIQAKPAAKQASATPAAKPAGAAKPAAKK